MQALIYKDLFIMKQKAQILALLSNVLIMCVIGIIIQDVYGLALMVILSIPVGGSAFIQIVMEKEERTQFDKTVISLPVTKQEIILARFITSFLYLLIQMFIGFIYMLVYVYAFKVTDLGTGCILWFIGLLIGSFMIAINSVGYHLLGTRKGTFVYLVLLGISVVVYLIVFLGFDVQIVLNLGVTILLLVGTAVTIITNIICYYVSLYIFNRKYS